MMEEAENVPSEEISITPSEIEKESPQVPKQPLATPQSPLIVQPRSNSAFHDESTRAPSSPTDTAIDSSGISTIQSGLWGLWNTVSNTEVVKAAVSSARNAADIAISHVQEHGVMQSAIDGAHAAVESAKHVDSTLLQGKITRLVDTTLQAAHKGMDKMMEKLQPNPKGNPDETGCDEPKIILTSTAFEKVEAVRSALQSVYGDCSLRAVAGPSGVAPQPCGAAAGFAGAEGRIEAVRRQQAARPGEIFISIENFISEIIPDCWMDIAALVLRDDENDITVRILSQAVNVPKEFVDEARRATPEDYGLRSTGFATTVGEIIHAKFPAISNSDWHQTLAGFSRMNQLRVACIAVLAQHTAALRALGPARQRNPAQ